MARRVRKNGAGLGFMRIAVLGAGAWGTALAISLSSSRNSSHDVMLWSRDHEHLAELESQHVNRRYFPAFPLPIACS